MRRCARAVASVLGCTITGFACSPSSSLPGGTNGPDAAGVDAAPDARSMPPLPDPPGDRTLDYVLRIVRVGAEEPAPGSRVAVGLDVDGHVTAREDDPVGCGHVDFVAPDRYGATPGVDNRLGPLLQQVENIGATLDADAEIASNIETGTLLMLVRILHVADGEALRDDGRVTVRVYLGVMADGGAPALEPVAHDGETLVSLRPGQRFDVAPHSVEGNDLERARYEWSGEIRDGRLRTEPSTLHLEIPIRDAGTLVLDVRDARIEADVADETLTLGVLGGYLVVDEIVDNVRNRLRIPAVEGITEETLRRSLVEPEADIDLTDRFGCEGLTMGFAVEGVSATIEGVADAP